MKIGLLKEGKIPPDKRVPFSPAQCAHIMNIYPKVSICIQPSLNRCFSDKDYVKKGVFLQQDLSDCDVIMGVKEVPVDMLLDQKLFFFFSHTIKKQPYNKILLQKIIQKKIQLVDYETLVDDKNKRIIGFGRYAGIVGCYNTFLAYGYKTKKYHLSFAHLLDSKKDLEKELLKVELPSDFKIILTGSGRVASGVIEILDCLGVKKISKEDFINNDFNYPTYVQLSPLDYNERIDGKAISKDDFYSFPERYQSCLLNYAIHANMLITGHYYASNSPTILSRKDFRCPSLNIEVVGDISCDIDGPIGCTIRPSTIQSPIYGYNPSTEKEDDYTDKNNIVVMAVDNLPCSLPKDASIDFGQTFIDQVLPDLISKRVIVSRATIAMDGELSKRFRYLSDYIS